MVGSSPASCSAATTFGKRPGSTIVMSRPTEVAPVRWSRRKMARATRVARVELVHEALAVRAVERRALAADGLGDQEALLALEADDRRRVELRELEVGEHRAGLAGEQQAGAERAGRVGRARPQRGGAAGGEQRAPWPGSSCRRSSATPPCFEDRGGAVAFEDVDAGVLDDGAPTSARRIRRPVALPPAWMMRRRLWPPSRPSARSPWRSASNWHAELDAGRAPGRGPRRSGPRPRRGA